MCMFGVILLNTSSEAVRQGTSYAPKDMVSFEATTKTVFKNFEFIFYFAVNMFHNPTHKRHLECL